MKISTSVAAAVKTAKRCRHAKNSFVGPTGTVFSAGQVVTNRSCAGGLAQGRGLPSAAGLFNDVVDTPSDRCYQRWRGDDMSEGHVHGEPALGLGASGSSVSLTELA